MTALQRSLPIAIVLRRNLISKVGVRQPPKENLPTTHVITRWKFDSYKLDAIHSKVQQAGNSISNMVRNRAWKSKNGNNSPVTGPVNLDRSPMGIAQHRHQSQTVVWNLDFLRGREVEVEEVQIPQHNGCDESKDRIEPLDVVKEVLHLIRRQPTGGVDCKLTPRSKRRTLRNGQAVRAVVPPGQDKIWTLERDMEKVTMLQRSIDDIIGDRNPVNTMDLEEA